jgi:hypothetical protein
MQTAVKYVLRAATITELHTLPANDMTTRFAITNYHDIACTA